MATSVVFAGLDMNDGTTYITHDIDHMRGFERNMPIFNLARANGAVITDSLYGTKTIPHTGRIRGTSVADIESKIDAFNQTMSGFKKNLDIGFAGSTRRYVATASKATISRENAGSQWAEFSVEYTVTDFGTDTTSTSLLTGVANTSSTYIPSVNIGGSAPLQPIVITIVVTAATGLSNKTISVMTGAGALLSVRRTWAVNEILTIDEAALSTVGGQPVRIGNTPIDFTGYFPSLAPGNSQSLTFMNDFTTRTLTYSISQTKRYL